MLCNLQRAGRLQWNYICVWSGKHCLVMSSISSTQCV